MKNPIITILTLCLLLSGGYTLSSPLPDVETVVPVTRPGSYEVPGTTYRLENDITCERSALFLGKDVTLDLNGFTITYAAGSYINIPNRGFEEGTKGWDLSLAPGAKVVNTRDVHTFIGKKILSMEAGDEVTSPYITLPVANRSYFAMCGITGRYYKDLRGDLKNDMKISIFVDDAEGNEVRCMVQYGDTLMQGCPVTDRSPRLGGGFIYAHLKDLPAGKYRVRIKAETDCLVDEIDIRPALDVGIGIVGRTHPYGHYDHLYSHVHAAFYDYTADFPTGAPVHGIPAVSGKGTVTIKNGTIKNGSPGILSWGIQSTAEDVRLILDNVRIEAEGINTNAIDVPHATITNCTFDIRTPFIINRHGSEFYAVDLRGETPSEVSGSRFYGGQGCLVIKGNNSIVHHNLFVNRQTVTNHYCVMAMGDGSMFFENRFEPETGSGLEIFRHKNIEVFNNEFIIRAAPPSCEYHEHYSTNAIRVADYGAEWGSPRGAFGNRFYNNRFHITGKKFREYQHYIPAANAFFFSASAGDNEIFGNEITVVQEDPDTDAEAFAFYIGNARGGKIHHNKITSNVTPIWVAAGYGAAAETEIYENMLIMVEGSRDFAPVRMGSKEQRTSVAENVTFRSNELKGLPFRIDATQQDHSYEVAWNLEIHCKNISEPVEITDRNGKVVLKQNPDVRGILNLVLPEYSVKGSNKDYFGPYTIVSGSVSKVVDLKANTKIKF